MSIEARIAQVISIFDVALNAGSDAGVVVNAVATIFRDVEVNDPESGEPLGVVRRPLLHFKVAEVQPKFCVATTIGAVRRTDDDNMFANVLQNSPQRLRITANEKARDWRTRLRPDRSVRPDRPTPAAFA